MKLTAFKKILDAYLERNPEENNDDLEVVVRTHDPSVGGSSFSTVTAVSKGFDWESGRLNIYTEDQLVEKANPIQIDLTANNHALHKGIMDAVTQWSNGTKSERIPARLAQKIYNITKKHNGKK